MTMSTNDQFQKLLETFGLDLQKFIKEEVKQQVALATGSVDRNKAEETKLNSSKNTTLDVTEDLKGLENILIDLKSKSAKKDTNQQVDDLISSLENFSSDNADSLSELLANASSTSASRVSNDDYLEKLMLLQKNDNNSSSDSEDSLESLLSFTKENDVDKIKEAFVGVGGKKIMLSRKDLNVPIVLTSWGYLFKLETVDTAKIKEFIETNNDRALEKAPI